MLKTGLDIGSRNIKIAIIEDNKIIHLKKTETGFDPIERCKKLLESIQTGSITATGYGRHLAEKAFNCKTVSEISAFAKGAIFSNPLIQTVIDVGGQDTKIIRTNSTGHILSFEMNDKCAAGTGKFLEIMAKTLEMDMNDFGNSKIIPGKDIKITNLCTVFAESEVISLIGSGDNRLDISYALHKMAVERIYGLSGRVGISFPIMLAGGCAHNKLFTKLLAEKLKTEIHLNDYPEFTGAIGAALCNLTTN